MFGFQWPMSITTEREIYWSGLAAEKFHFFFAGMAEWWGDNFSRAWAVNGVQNSDVS
jgi:hypothetical protein